MSGAWTPVRRGLMVVLLALIWLSPESGSPPTPRPLVEVDVLVVVDRTHSMTALDYGPAGSPRIDAVRRDLATLAQALPGARFALVTFGKVARVELPFTSDVAAFRDQVDAIRVEPVDQGSGTRVDRPLDTIREILDRSVRQRPDDQRLLVVVSDGENTASGKPRSYAALADDVDAGVVLGYGTEAGGVMPVAEDAPAAGLVVDPRTGEVARSRADEPTLRRVAHDLDVSYEHRRSPEGMVGIADRMRAELAPSVVATPAYTQLAWLLALALLGLTLVELREAWRGWLEARRVAAG